MLNEIDLTGVDLNLLVLFESLMRERHVARAAKRVHVSPSAVSHGLGRLRRTLNDPLFLKHPKGIVPTERALELAEPIADILQRVRGVLSSAEGFDARRSARRFTIGAPDAVFPIVLPPLLTALVEVAPRIDLAMRTVLPPTAFAALDAREVDVVVEPIAGEIPLRFASTLLYEEDFAIAMRRGHPLASKLTLPQYCNAAHVLVSLTGDPFGNVDIELKKLGKSRRIVATVPNFLLALALVAETDMIAAVPKHSTVHAARFGLVLVNPPAPLAPLGRSSLHLVATKAALADPGVGWLFRTIAEAVPARRSRRRPEARSSDR